MSVKQRLINYSLIFAMILSFCGILGSFQATSYADSTTVCNDTKITSGSNVGSSSFCQNHSTSPSDPIFSTLNLVINIVSGIAGFVAVVMIVISGLQMVSSGGNPEKISSARNTILYALIGLIIVVLSRILVLFILKKVT